MPDVTDYGPTIADLERKRDEIDRTIQMLRALSGLASVETPSRGTGNGGGAVEFTNKHFFGMKAPEAVLFYLESVKEARGVPQIARDLVEHGFITTSDAPSEVIRTALRRLQTAGQVVQVKKDWGLPSWYPGLRRPPVETEARKSGAGASKKKKQKKKAPFAPKTLKAGSMAGAKTSEMTWSQFSAAALKEGKSMAEASAEWRARKAQS